MAAKHRSWFGLCFSLALALGIIGFLVAASGTLPNAVAYAGPLLACSTTNGPPCLLGPNLELVSETGPLFSGSGACVGGTSTFTLDPTNPGFGVTGIPTPCSGFSITQSGTISATALNGFAINAFTGSVNCGVTGGDSLSFLTNSISAICPTETTVGATGTVPSGATFSPVTSLDLNVTLANTFVTGGSSSLSSSSSFYSLVQTPEPSSLLLLLVGLCGLGIIKFKMPKSRRRASGTSSN
jgi:hypothetical protein